MLRFSDFHTVMTRHVILTCGNKMRLERKTIKLYYILHRKACFRDVMKTVMAKRLVWCFVGEAKTFCFSKSKKLVFIDNNYVNTILKVTHC